MTSCQAVCDLRAYVRDLVPQTGNTNPQALSQASICEVRRIHRLLRQMDKAAQAGKDTHHGDGPANSAMPSSEMSLRQDCGVEPQRGHAGLHLQQVASPMRSYVLYPSARVINVFSSRVKILNVEAYSTHQDLGDFVYYDGSTNFYKGSHPLVKEVILPCGTKIYYPGRGVRPTSGTGYYVGCNHPQNNRRVGSCALFSRYLARKKERGVSGYVQCMKRGNSSCQSAYWRPTHTVLER